MLLAAGRWKHANWIKTIQSDSQKTNSIIISDQAEAHELGFELNGPTAQAENDMVGNQLLREPNTWSWYLGKHPALLNITG